MFATLRRAKIKPDTSAEIARRIQEGFIPMMNEIEGFVAFYVVDQGDAISTLSVFASREAAEQANQHASGWIREQLGEFIAGPPEMSLGELLIHHHK